MNDNDIYRLLIPIITSGLTDRGVTGVGVKQKYQPTQQGVPEAPTIYLYKIAANRYGFPGRIYKYNTTDGDFDTTETVWRNPIFQISGLNQQDPSDTSGLTASDLVEIVADIIQSPATRQTLLDSGVGILRVTTVRLVYFNNDKDRFEQEPSFDIVLSYRNDFALKTPALQDAEGTITRV